MFRSLKRALRRDIHSAYVPPKTDIGGEPNLSDNLTRNLFEIRRRFSNTSDLIIRELDHGPVKIALLMCEGMFNLADLNKLVLVPMSQNKAGTAKEFLDWVRSDVFFSGNQIEIRTYDEAMTLMMSGFVVLMIDGECPATAIGLQGYKSRSVSEPSSEVNVRGSKEGFVEPLRVNMSLVRRRMRTPALKMELMTIEGGAKTDVCLVYRVDRVNPKELDRVREQAKANLLMGAESVQTRMSHLGSSALLCGRVREEEEILALYDAVTREQVRELAGELFQMDQASLSAVGRVGAAQDYARWLGR